MKTQPTSKPKSKRRAKQRWPFITKRVYPSGLVGWIVDPRIWDEKAGKLVGERKTFETVTEAETFAASQRIKRGNEGNSAFADGDLAKYGKTVADAVAFYLDHLRREEKSVPLETAIAELVQLKAAAGKKPRYCHDLVLRLGRMGKAFPGRTVASIATNELDAWLAAQPVAPGTRNTFRRDLRTLFSFCEKRGYSASNPAKNTERANDVAGTVEILTCDEALAVLNACGSDTLAYTAIGLYAGLRAAEIAKLDWSEVDIAGGVIEVKAQKAKTASHRLVKIEPILAQWLAPVAKLAGPVTPAGLRNRLDAARRRAGFGPLGSETAEETKAGVKLKAWPQNALRHSFGTYWLAVHYDAAACALQMGNSPAMVFAHYRRPMKGAEAERFWALKPSSEASAKVVQMAT